MLSIISTVFGSIGMWGDEGIEGTHPIENNWIKSLNGIPENSPAQFELLYDIYNNHNTELAFKMKYNNYKPVASASL